ncbi:krev interaction trapped protein 1-like [Haliotis rufescens]|uniref:krev interaction trapped protein 1-like n=1 Tax=Haliotis rufescens TaxID=6454 RepID=UPI00201EE749|nr:krev interaction trapped protein 1-like [Haliotis rufescens]
MIIDQNPHNMEGVLAVIRPKANVARGDYRPRLYDILLLDSKTPPGDKVKAAKYLPMVSMKLGEDEPREMVLTHLYTLTGGDMGLGIKGERAILVPPHQSDSSRGPRESLSRFSLFCVPISQLEKLSKRYVDQAQNAPGFYSMEAVIEMLSNGSVNFPSPTLPLLQHLGNWLREKHMRSGSVEALFRSRAEYRMRLTVHNPVFLSSRISPEDSGTQNLGDLPAEIQLTANEARAKMLSIEKCDIVVINPLFGSGLQYKTKVNRLIENNFWPQKPDYGRIVVPDPIPEALKWREKYPVHSCAAEGDLDGVKTLLSQGQLHSKKDSISWAPIHYAAWYGYSNVVTALLDAGCSPNIADREDSTPLHLAARKGHSLVAETLLVHRVDVAARDKNGKTALDICQSGPDHTWKHEQVANFIKQSGTRPSPTIAVNTMDANIINLRLTSGYHTSVRQLNEQMLKEFGMPPVPYAQIFTIWICSNSLELQLKPEHEPMNQLRIWQTRTVGMLSDANPDHEEPVLKWRRNAKIGVEIEKQLTHQKAIDLLFHEAYYNYINALYPCKEQDAVIFAAILFLLWHGNLDSSSAKSFLSNREKQQELVPQPILVQRGATHWANKILRECREIIQGKDRTPLALKRQFLTHCHYLTVYGSAFFTGTLPNPQGIRGSPTKCHIGVNDVGIHIISMQNKSMLQSYKYSEIEWQHVQEYSLLEIHVTRPEGKTGRISPKTVTKIRSKQAGLINFLMVKLAQMHD